MTKLAAYSGMSSCRFCRCLPNFLEVGLGVRLCGIGIAGREATGMQKLADVQKERELLHVHDC